MSELRKPLKIYGCKLKNREKLMESQSGGAFTAIAETFLKKGAIVYGCGMNETNDAIYKRITCVEELSQIKGSKYVQAKLQDTYSLIATDLEQGKLVLFSGTPCYVNAIKKYFEKSSNKENLYTVDLVCHGVPSPLVYNRYLDDLEKKEHSKVVQFTFREKIGGGWHKHVEKIVYENGKIEYADGYTQLFYTNLPLRPSCGVCKFSNMYRTGDFTVGDYWGIEDVYPEFDDGSGVSLLFLNSSRAVDIFDEIKDGLEYFESDEKNAALQPNLKSPSDIPLSRDRFWNDFNDKGIGYCISHWSPTGIPFRIKRKIKYLLKKYFRIE